MKRVPSLVFSILCVLAGSIPTWAATFTVDSIVDAPDDNPGDGVCAAAGGECTLRAATQEANALVGPDTIILPAQVYVLTEGELDVSDSLYISGEGAGASIIDAAFRSRVLTIGSSIEVTMWGVTIQHGVAPGGLGPAGILNHGALTLSESVVRANNADCGEAGGILNAGGALTVMNTTINDNFSCGGGAGVLNLGGTLSVTASTASGNGTLFGAGGIANVGGVAMLTNSTVSGNVCTVVSPAWDYIGGILNRDGVLTLNNVTVTDNLCVYGVGGVLNEHAGTVTVGNTIVAKNLANADCAGPLISSGYSLDSDGSCGLNGPGDLSGVEPLLGPLQDNGGPTSTHALLIGSPAIDAGNPDTPGSGGATCEATDQRAVARPQGLACDMGAFEVVP